MSDFFDPDAFLNTETTEAGSTEFLALPNGEYSAYITSVDAKLVGDNNDITVLDLNWEVSHPEMKDELGRSTSNVRQRIFLDMKNGQLDMGRGKNIQLNRVRDALGQNEPGQPWAPSKMLGGAAIVRCEQRIWEGRTFNDIKGVVALS